MNKIKNFTRTHWDELVILVITLIILLILFIPFFLTNSLDKFDTPGLLSLSWFIREYTFPDFQGWNPYFFAGFPQGILYPPLFHYIVAALGKIFTLQVAYKLIVTAAAVFIPYTIYELSLRIYKGKPWALLNTLFLLILLVFLPGYLGFNFDGLFDYGLGPSFVSIPLFFIYLTFLFEKKLSSKKLAVAFSILSLTHLLTAAVAGLITLGYLPHLNKRMRKALIIFALITFALTAFWTIPFLVFKNYSASGVVVKISAIFPMGILLLTLVGLGFLIITKQWSKQGKLLALLKTSFLIGFLGFADSMINSPTTKFSIPLIHPFRVQIYGILLVIATLPFLVQQLHPLLIKLATRLKRTPLVKELYSLTFTSRSSCLAGRPRNIRGRRATPRRILRNLHISTNLTFATLVLFVLILIRLNPNGVEELKLTHPPDWEGRIMRAYKVTEVLDQSRAVIDKSVMQNPDKFAVDGLLKESSYLAPYFQSLSKSLNPDNFNWDELDQYYIENRQIPFKKTQYLMNVLWIKSLFTIDENFPGCNVFQHLTSFTTNSKAEGLVDRDMYICSYEPSRNSNFAHTLVQKPKVASEKWQTALDDWWLSEDMELFVDREIQGEFQNEVSYLPDVQFSDDFQEVFLKTGVDEEQLVLVKMSYFPKWKAYDKEGNEVPIYRTSPNFMTLPVEEEVTLRYEMTRVEWASLIISVVSWIGLGVVGIARKLKGI